MRYRKPPSFFGWLPIAVHVAITVIFIIVGMKVLPWWHRHDMIGKLTDARLAQREKALNYVVRRAKTDEKIRSAAIDQLIVPDPVNFLQLVNALDQAGLWRRPTITAEPWLRWIKVLANAPLTATRLNATNQIADLVDLADQSQIHALLEALITDVDSMVRYRALVTIGQLAGAAKDSVPYETLIVNATNDSEHHIARCALIMLGFLGTQSGIVANWRNRPAPIAETILWTTLATHPDNPTPAIEAIQDKTVDSSVRAMAAYCLHLSPTDEAHHALVGLIEMQAQSTLATGQLLFWRALLAMNKPIDIEAANMNKLTERFNGTFSIKSNEPVTNPLVLSSLYRGLLPVQLLLETLSPGRKPQQTLAILAVLEGLATNQHHIKMGPLVPEMLRLKAWAITENPQATDFRELFVSEEPAIANLACLVAVDRLPKQELARLVASLLIDFNDHAKCSGAILAGLTGYEPKLLEKKARDEDIWSVKQVMEIGLWMQGSRPKMADRISGLLSRDDLPKTTVLLAMLHQGQSQALEYLFNPDDEPRLDLIELFDQFRWWCVLERYLPDSAPPFWIWADPELQQFQLEVLRVWYILNRHALRHG